MTYKKVLYHCKTQARSQQQHLEGCGAMFITNFNGKVILQYIVHLFLKFEDHTTFVLYCCIQTSLDF